MHSKIPVQGWNGRTGRDVKCISRSAQPLPDYPSDPRSCLATYSHLACFQLLSLLYMLKLWKESAWKDGSGNQDAGSAGDSLPSGTCLDGPSLDAAVAVPLRTEVSLTSGASLSGPFTTASKHGASGDKSNAPRKRAKVQGPTGKREPPLAAKGVYCSF